jgi:hypothetical protein
MTTDEEIIRLLTEIRDNQLEDIAWRRKVTEDSIRLQRLGFRSQRIGLAIGGLAIVAALVAGLLAIAHGMGLFGR